MGATEVLDASVVRPAPDTGAHAPAFVGAPVAPAAPAAPVVPVRVAAGARESMVELAGLIPGASGWSAEERLAVLARMTATIDGLTAARAGLLVAVREAEDWRGAGDRSFAAWWGRLSRLGQRSAGAQVRQAAQLEVVPEVAEAVASGRIPFESATIIAKVAAGGTEPQRAAATSAEGQEFLLGLADELDAGTLATATERWAASVDPEGLERSHQEQWLARSLHLVTTPAGTLVKGQLDSSAGHRFALALEAVTPKPAADDDRDPGQRRADALDTIANRILGLKDAKPGAHVPPQVSVILTEETWAAVQRDGADLRGGGSRGYEPATLEDGTPVPFGELGAVLCDCELTRIVIDAEGVPLDLGRTERLVTGPQRRAVIARDRECGWPDCHAHARWCQIHHLRWWDRDDGATSEENGMLLCNFHHHEVHRRNLAINRVSLRAPGTGATGGASRPVPGTLARVCYEFTSPAGRVFGGRADPFTGARVPAFMVA